MKKLKNLNSYNSIHKNQTKNYHLTIPNLTNMKKKNTNTEIIIFNQTLTHSNSRHSSHKKLTKKDITPQEMIVQNNI